MFDKKKIEELLKGKKKLRIVVAMGMLGIILICISIFWPTSGEKVEQKTANETSIQKYQQELEVKLKDLVSQIEGVGNTKVMITLENGVEYIYANAQKQSTNTTSGNSNGQNSEKKDNQQDVVIVDGKNGKEALMVTQKEPTVKGVVVVCDGADEIEVECMIKDAVTTSLNIKSNRVSVVKASTQTNKK